MGVADLLDMRVPCDELAPAAVREKVRDLRDLDGALDDAMLVASELVTNAVRHSLCAEDEFVTVRVSRNGRFRIAVLDPGASGQSAETPIFAVTDAWGRRDVAATLGATESLLDRSHRPRSGELIRLVASLVGHIGRVRKASRLADEGVRSSEIASRLKMHPFVAEKATSASEH